MNELEKEIRGIVYTYCDLNADGGQRPVNYRKFVDALMEYIRKREEEVLIKFVLKLDTEVLQEAAKIIKERTYEG